MNLQMKATAIFDGIISLLALLGAVLLVFTVVAVCTEIIMSYSFGRPIQGVIEIVEYCLLYITFLVATWVLKREGHVRMDLVLNRLAPRTQSLLNIITSAICAIICLVLTWYGLRVTWFHYEVRYILATPLKPPSFPIVVIIPIGTFMLFIQFLRRTSEYFKRWSKLTNEQ